MANRTLPLNASLYRYLLAVGVREPEVLARLREATDRKEMAVMRSAPEQGQLMSLLLRLIGGRKVIEVGTYTGYATLWMALALPSDGWIITCEVERRWAFIARRFWEQAGVDGKIELHLQPAIRTLDALLEAGEEGEYDFAFIDADKENYWAYYERCLRLLRSGGLIVVDNTLWGGAVVDMEKRDAATEAIRQFNRRLHADERVELAMLPLADGVTLAMKR